MTGETAADKARNPAHAGEAHAAAHRMHAAAAHRMHATAAHRVHAASSGAAMPATKSAPRKGGRCERDCRAERSGHHTCQNPLVHTSLHLELRRHIPPQETTIKRAKSFNDFK